MINTILKLMEENHVTAKQLTSDLGLSGSAISEWKKGKGRPSTEAVVKIANYFQTSADYILGQEEESERAKGFLPERLQEVLGNMSSEELTQRFHYKPKVISDYLEGKRKPLNATLFQIAKALGVNPEWLYGLDAPKYEKPAPENGGGLSEKDVRLIAWFRSLPPEKRKAILMLGEAPEGLDE